MQYHQVRRLCALRDLILTRNPGMTEADAMAVTKERMKRLGPGSAILFDLKCGKERPPARERPMTDRTVDVLQFDIIGIADFDLYLAPGMVDTKTAVTVICGRVSGELDRGVSRDDDGGLVGVYEARIDGLGEVTSIAKIESSSTNELMYLASVARFLARQMGGCLTRRCSVLRRLTATGDVPCWGSLRQPWSRRRWRFQVNAQTDYGSTGTIGPCPPGPRSLVIAISTASVMFETLLPRIKSTELAR